MYQAKRDKIRNFLKRGTFKVVVLEALPTEATVLLGIFALKMNSTKNGEAKFTMRYLIGAHRERMKYLMFHSSLTM